MPNPNDPRSADLVLNGSQYAFVQDTTKGTIYVYVGHHKATLEQTDTPVRFEGGKFVPCSLSEAIQPFVLVDEGDYVVLQNPAKNSDQAFPPREKSPAAELQYGHTINIAGPTRFPLWPGQSVTVVKGHVLRSNQYLVARVTNGDKATQNWAAQAVLQPQTSPVVTPPTGGESTEPGAEATRLTAETPTVTPPSLKFVTGQRIVIKGTDYSFFIPPTGVEVVPDERRSSSRDAVTLESLQYCVLLSEDGRKRYVQGPTVVFPEANETFVKDEKGERVFKAFELNEQMGIHVKVIADYSEGGQNFKAGQELFITGKETQIYFPRAEHAIIPYRETEQVHFAVVIPAGEARYVLNKATGEIETVKGPRTLLCNPVTHVIVNRALSAKEASLWFPGNGEVETYNASLREAEAEVRAAGGDFYLSADAATESLRRRSSMETLGSSDRSYGVDRSSFVADRVERRPGFTKPKTITLKTKFAGAVALDVWPGYAIQVVSKSGSRRVVVGPANVILNYDETLAVFELSTGTPKLPHNPKHRDVYLRVVGNRVSDKVKAQTLDMVNVEINLSYRVNFEGDEDKWFALEDYVGFLTDHLRSVIRGAVKKQGIEKLINEAVDILRDAVLGTPADDKPRPGKAFAENGMRIYDLEILDVTIGDSEIDRMLVGAQKEAVSKTLSLQKKQRELELTKETEKVERQIAQEKSATVLAGLANQLTELEKEKDVDAARLANELAEQQATDKVEDVQRARRKADALQELTIDEAQQALELEKLKAEVAGTVARFGAIQPGLVEALQNLGDKETLVRIAANLKTIPMGIDEGMGDVLQRLLQGTVIENAVNGSR